MKKCCIVGHRKIEESNELKAEIEKTIIELIEKGFTIFLFGSRSEFNYFCYEIVSDLKRVYPNIKRVFVRAEYPIISNDYKEYLLDSYEDTYYYSEDISAGKLSYVKRNYAMIDISDYCLFYYNDTYKLPNKTKSGTMLSYNYAVKKRKPLRNFYSSN